MDVRNSRGRMSRSRTNPLVRGSDRVEAFVAVLLLATAFSSIGFAVWLGGTVTASARLSDSRWLATSYPATAVVTDYGRTTAGPVGDGVGSPWLTHVTWADPDGVQHNGLVTAARALPMGVPIAVRVDAQGWPRVAQPSDPVSAGMVVGVFGLLVTWGLLALLWVVVENLVLSYNLRAWDAAWRRFAPHSS